jgi:hypothetical protein
VLPAVVNLAFCLSAFGLVMIRGVNPLAVAPVAVATVFAPTINSLALVVVAALQCHPNSCVVFKQEVRKASGLGASPNLSH